MGGLTQRDLKHTLDFLNDLSAQQDVAGFLQHASVGLSRLVASDITTLSVCDLVAGKRRVFTWPENAITADDLSRFDRFIYQHPLVKFHSRHPKGGSHKISDSLTLGGFRQLGLYSEYYRPLGIDYVMAVPLIAGKQAVISFVLNREIRDFSEHDRQLLDLARPGLSSLYRNMVTLEEARKWVAQLRELALGDRGSTVVLDSVRRIRQVSPRVSTQLGWFMPGCRLEIGGRLPDRIDRWLAQQLAATMETSSSAALQPLTLERDGRMLSIAAVADSERNDWYLLLQERSPQLTPERLASLPLTSREREVLLWVAAGKTNPEIAAIIGASVRTVQKHLEHVFVKLGVETRTAAVARAFGLTAALQAQR